MNGVNEIVSSPLGKYLHAIPVSDEVSRQNKLQDIPFYVYLEMQLSSRWLQQLNQIPHPIILPQSRTSKEVSIEQPEAKGNRLSQSIFHHPSPTFCLASGGRVWYDMPIRAQTLCIASKSVDRLLKIELKPSKEIMDIMTAARPAHHAKASTQWHLYDWNMYEHTSDRHCIRYHPERSYHPYHQTWLSA